MGAPLFSRSIGTSLNVKEDVELSCTSGHSHHIKYMPCTRYDISTGLAFGYHILTDIEVSTCESYFRCSAISGAGAAGEVGWFIFRAAAHPTVGRGEDTQAYVRSPTCSLGSKGRQAVQP